MAVDLLAEMSAAKRSRLLRRFAASLHSGSALGATAIEHIPRLLAASCTRMNPGRLADIVRDTGIAPLNAVLAVAGHYDAAAPGAQAPVVALARAMALGRELGVTPALLDCVKEGGDLVLHPSAKPARLRTPEKAFAMTSLDEFLGFGHQISRPSAPITPLPTTPAPHSDGYPRLPEYLEVPGNFRLTGGHLGILPARMTIRGTCTLSECTGDLKSSLSIGERLFVKSCPDITAMPDGLTVGFGISMDGLPACVGFGAETTIGALGQGAVVYEEELIHGISLANLPQFSFELSQPTLKGDLRIASCPKIHLLSGWNVASLAVRDTPIKSISNTAVAKNLFLVGCQRLETIPHLESIQGDLGILDCQSLNASSTQSIRTVQGTFHADQRSVDLLRGASIGLTSVTG